MSYKTILFIFLVIVCINAKKSIDCKYYFFDKRVFYSQAKYFCHSIKDDDIDQQPTANDIHRSNAKMSKQHRIALNRDWYARENPDELLYGFCPIWAIGMILISITFLLVAVVSAIGYLAGFKRPEAHNAKRKQSTSFLSSTKSVTN